MKPDTRALAPSHHLRRISKMVGFTLILTSCGADGTLKTPTQMTPAERCANAQGTLLAMKVGGAWPSSIAEGEKTVAEICVEARQQ
jgi:hypothetical protein